MYFITFTVHQWVDVFTRKDFTDVLLDSIEYCQKEKRAGGICLGS